MNKRSNVVCVARGSDNVESAFNRLDEMKVQLIYTKFPVGTGSFKRNKFIYLIFIGPKCSVVKRGQGIAEINQFKNILQGSAGISTTEKSTLSLHYLIQQMHKIFVTDGGEVSLDKIQEEYKSCVREQARKMHIDIPPIPPKRVPRPVSQEELEMPSISSVFLDSQISVDCEIDNNVREVLNALHTELGPLNWATFEANPVHLTLADAGNGGIFELVNKLPETKWLFGLFRITLGTKEGRLSRLIFFQWIGNKLKLVRKGCTTKIFPKMASILSPYEYEVYLVGAQDLKPQVIINKCRYAFENQNFSTTNGHNDDNTSRNAKNGTSRITSTFTEDEYSCILKEEISKMDLSFDFIRPKKKEDSIVFVDDQPGENEDRIFDTQETLNLINQSEGGLIWGIFEVC